MESGGVGEGARAPVAEAPEGVAQEGESVGAGMKRVALAVLKLAAAFVPEVLSIVVFGALGLAAGLVLGVEETVELFSGSGVWARAGPIALLFPLFTFLGPAFAGLVAGVLAPLPLVLLVHSAVLVPFARRDRHFVLWVTTALYVTPVIFAIVGGPAAVLGALFLIGPFTGALGLVGSLAWYAARIVLNGRSLGAWWANADRSMLGAATLLTVTGSVILWGGCVLFPLLPFSPVALVLSSIFCARLALRGRRRVPAALLGVANLLHLAVIGLLIHAVITDPPGRQPGPPAASEAR